MRPVLKVPQRKLNLFETDDSIRHLLLESVGSFCAYCESPLTVDLTYTNKVLVTDKTQSVNLGGNEISGVPIGFPPRTKLKRSWINQQLFCSACAQASTGYLPGFNEGLRYLERYNTDLYNPLFVKITNHQWRQIEGYETEALFTGAIQSWISPDLSDDESGDLVSEVGGDYSFDVFTYLHESKTPMQLLGDNLIRLDATEQQQPWSNQPQLQLWVVPNDEFIQSWQQDNPQAPALRERALATIKALNLNHHNPSLQNRFDRRVPMRTNAHSIAIDSLNRFRQLLAKLLTMGLEADELLNRHEYALMLDSIRDTLRATGFWSVWARVFAAALFPSGGNAQAPWNRISPEDRSYLLYSLLIEYEIDTRFLTLGATVNQRSVTTQLGNVIEGVVVIPGTDVNRLASLLEVPQ